MKREQCKRRWSGETVSAFLWGSEEQRCPVPTWTIMVPNIHPAVPLLPRGVAPLLLLISCLVLCSNADSLPMFVKSLEDQTGISGNVASFVCQATGVPKPRITWMKKDGKVSSQRFEVIEFDDGSGSVLRIQPLRKYRDETIYECIASNTAGKIKSSAKLTVFEGNTSNQPLCLPLSP
ncbi:hypothetical protein UPYG_G00246430 [Umbra pygmaea]|uniref:Ig-like domain-containing protein n=1 Tax=Umbra pygmaea TaxID=75934 RepID=A0ABD0WHZ3_UMBPY